MDELEIRVGIQAVQLRVHPIVVLQIHYKAEIRLIRRRIQS